jgi:hypothetical protein
MARVDETEKKLCDYFAIRTPPARAVSISRRKGGEGVFWWVKNVRCRTLSNDDIGVVLIDLTRNPVQTPFKRFEKKRRTVNSAAGWLQGTCCQWCVPLSVVQYSYSPSDITSYLFGWFLFVPEDWSHVMGVGSSLE